MSNTNDRRRLSDRELVTQFLQSRDENAFAELVRRYCSLVLGVARRVLKDDQDAEDVFQATFLILVRDVGKIRSRESIASWLYGVAYRTALRAAARKSRRPEVLLGDMNMAVDRSLIEVASHHDRRLLDEELNRLPEKYRAPLVLHYLLGKSRQEVARELGLSSNAVKGRLQRGRNRLRLRLAIRGVSLALVAAYVETCHQSVVAASLEPLISSTVGEAISYSSGHSTALSQSVVELAGKETTVMYATTSTVVGAVVTAAAVAGLALATQPSRLMAETPEATVVLADQQRAEDAIQTSSVLVIAAVSQQRSSTGERKNGSSAPLTLKYGDAKADGKKSLGGSGEMIRFQLPNADAKVRGIRVHGARYGYPQPPKEDFLIYLLDAQGEEILHTETAPYSLFKRGPSKWTTVRFKKPLAVSETFQVALDFKAGRTKGVYVSYDTSTDGENSLAGLPGKEQRATGFDGDWMIQVLLAR